MIGWKSRAEAPCREAQADLPETPVAAERIRIHRLHCEPCQRHAETVEEIKVAIFEVDRGLDDLARARIEARIGPELDRLASERSTRGGRRFVLAGAAVLGAAAAVLVLAWWGGLRSERVLVEPTPGIVVHSVTDPRAGRAHPEPALETPLLQVAVAEGAQVAAEIQGEAKVELVGGGTLRQIAAPAEVVALSLDRGLLLVDVEHRPGGTWQIHCRGVTVTVVGTRFAVDARDTAHLAVEVLRGVVAVVDGERPEARVTAGRGWDRASGLRAIDPALEARLARLGTADVPPQAPAPPQEAPRALVPETSARAPEPPLEVSRPRLSAEASYQKAERAMARGDRSEATRLLEDLVRRFPADPRASSALLELARIAEERGEPRRARGYLEDLLARDPDPAIAEPAQHRLCRLSLEAGATDAALQCFIAFRRRFPSSPRDREVLRAIIGLSEAGAGCVGARPWLEEWTRSYPSDALTGEIQERLDRCRE